MDDFVTHALKVSYRWQTDTSYIRCTCGAKLAKRQGDIGTSPEAMRALLARHMDDEAEAFALSA
jgi:hypothetical protein